MAGIVRKIALWRAMLRGECKQIGPTEAEVRDLKGNAWYTPRNRKNWKFVAEERILPVVQGKWIVAQRWYIDLEKPVPTDLGPPHVDAPHIAWRCPYCKEDHFTDVDVDQPSPGLWFCENARRDEIALVKWKKPRTRKTASGTQPSRQHRRGRRR